MRGMLRANNPSSITELENDGEAESVLKREPWVILSRPPSLPGPRGVWLPCTQAVAEGNKSTSSPPNFEFSGAD